MTNEIFKEVLAKLDVDMTAQNRKIFLYIDNCAAHGHKVEMQSRLKLCTLPISLLIQQVISSH